MVAVLLILGAGVFLYYMLNGTGTGTRATKGGHRYSVDYGWKKYESVGTKSDGVEIIVEAKYKLTASGSIAETPSPEKWRFRASQISGGITTPFAGHTQAEAFEVFGRTPETEAVPRGQWGVQYQTALEAAENRLTVGSQGGTGSGVGAGEAETGSGGPTPPIDTDTSNLDSDGFPSQFLDSFTGTPIDASTTGVATAQARSTDLLSEGSEFGLL